MKVTKKEMEFMKKNALKNTTKGIAVDKAAYFIKKIACKNNLKSSYTIGADAGFAKFYHYFRRMSLILLLSLA